MDYGTIQTLEQPEFGVHGSTGSATKQEATRLPLPATPANESIVQGAPNTGFSEAFLASAAENTLMGLVFDPFSHDDSHYNADSTFDVNQAIRNYTQAKGVALDKEEMEFLTKAVSPENFAVRIARWQKKQDNQKLMQGSTLGTLAGAAFDPVDFVLGAGVTKLKALSAIEQVAVAGATAGAISTATPNTLSDSDVLLNMVGPMIGAAIGGKAVKEVGIPTQQGTLKGMAESPVPVQYHAAPAKKVTTETTSSGVDIVEQQAQVNRSIVEVNTIDELSQYSKNVASGFTSVPADTKVVYLPDSDFVAVVKSNITPNDNLPKLLLAEVGARMNLERTIGTEVYLRLLDDLEKAALNGDTVVADAFKRVSKHVRTQDVREYALAELIKSAPDNSIVTKLILRVKEYLRGLGVDFEYSKEEVLELVNRSFTNSRGSSDATLPYVWHGSPVANIEKLEIKYAGSGEGNAGFGFGHYLTSEKGTAIEYRNKEAIRRGLKPEDGGLYRVKLNVDLNKLLDWDGQQSSTVKSILASHGLHGTGKQIYTKLTAKLGSNKAASEFLDSLGVGGIRYNSGKTRHAEVKNSNFVIFSDNGVGIVQPSGQPVLKSTNKTFKSPSEATAKMANIIEGLKSWQSFTDSLKGLGPKGSDIADRVFGNAWEDKATSATAFQRNFAADAQRQLASMEEVMTKYGLFNNSPAPNERAALRKQREAVGVQVQEWLHASRKHEMEFGQELPLPTDPMLRDIIETYQKSGFATEMLRRAKEAGVEGAIGKITPEPVVWDEAATEALRNSHEVFGSVDRQSIHSFSMLYTDMMNRNILPKYYKARKEVNAMLDEGKQVDFRQYLKDNTKLSDKDIRDMTKYDMANKIWFKSIASNVLQGEDPKAVMKLWRDTYDKMKQQKWDEAYAKAQKEGVFETRNYAGIVWNYDRVRDFMLRSGKSLDEVAEAFGKQIVKSIGHFAGSDAVGVGKQFLKSIQGEETGDLALKFSEWQTNGLTRDEIVATLRGAGIPDPQILRAVDNMFGNPNMNSVGDVTKSLRQRLDWDLSEDMGGFKLSSFLEPDIHKTMERYTLEMTSRIGLAKVGFRSGGEFQKALDEVADEAFAAGKSPAEVRKILDHARELALGRPVGDLMPDSLRSLTALGSALVLRNSGIYNIGEYAALAAEYGLKRVVAEFMPALRKSSIKHMTKQEAEELQDIITGRLVADGRFRPVVSYMEDNFEGAVDSVHESIQYAAQSVRFINGSESVRRHQVKVFAALYQKRLESAIKGNAKARQLLLDEGLPPNILDDTAKEFNSKGWSMETWNPSTVDNISTHALSMADTCVLALRRGERPMLMDTNVGKTIFPFMSFVFAAHNKLLRRQLNRDGVLGVAKIMLYQAPLAVLAAAAANIVGGKEWDADMGNGVPKAMSSLGLASIPLDLLYRGRMGGGFSGFAPINSAVELGSIPDTPRGVTENIPFLATFLPINVMLSAFEGEDK